MPFKFQWVGGSEKPIDNEVNKFLLFVIVNGREIPIWTMVKDGLVIADPTLEPDNIPEFIKEQVRNEDGEVDQKLLHHFSKGHMRSTHRDFKLFMYHEKYGRPPKRASFFFRLMKDRGGKQVIARSFLARRSEYVFSAESCILLSPAEGLRLLDKQSKSAKILARDIEKGTGTLPKVTRDMLLSVKTPVLKQIRGVRKLKI